MLANKHASIASEGGQDYNYGSSDEEVTTATKVAPRIDLRHPSPTSPIRSRDRDMSTRDPAREAAREAARAAAREARAARNGRTSRTSRDSQSSVASASFYDQELMALHEQQQEFSQPSSPVSSRGGYSFEAHQSPSHSTSYGYGSSRRGSNLDNTTKTATTTATTTSTGHSYTTPTSPVSPTHSFHSQRSFDLKSPTLTSSVTPQDAWGKALEPALEVAEAVVATKEVKKARNSWEETNDSEDEPYSAGAYDYGPEDEEDADGLDEYEERPRSAKVAPREDSYSYDYGHEDRAKDTESEEEEEEVRHPQPSEPIHTKDALSTTAAHQNTYDSEDDQESIQHHSAPAAQKDMYDSDDYHQQIQRQLQREQQHQAYSSDEYEEPVQKQAAPVTQPNGYDSDAYEERHQPQAAPDHQHHAYDSDEYEDAQQPQQRVAPAAQNGYDSDEYEKRVQTVPAPQHQAYDSDEYQERTQQPQEHTIPAAQNGYDTDEYEENVGPQEQNAYSYGHQEAADQYTYTPRPQSNGYNYYNGQPAQHQEYSHEQKSDSDEDEFQDADLSEQQHKEPAFERTSIDNNGNYATASQRQSRISFEDVGFTEGEAPNNSTFLASAENRASANSFSSHTKHHSFGYEDRPAASESESESESESDPEQAIPLAHPAAPPVPTYSRPTSTISSVPGSPVVSRSMAATHHPEIKEEPLNVQTNYSSPAVKARPTSSLKSASPISLRKPFPPISTAPAAVEASLAPEPLAVDAVSQKSVSSASSIDRRQRRYSGSDSDTSGTSIDIHSPSLKGHGLKNMNPPSFKRTMSTSSAHGLANGPNNNDKQRPISYATVFSDAELNDVSLLDEPMNDKRVSVPRTPVTPSASFGFPSNFFGGRAHPKAQPTTPQASIPSAPALATVPAPAPAPVQAAPTPVVHESRAGMSRSGSISAFANSLQGFMGRSFSAAQSAPPTPPLPRTPSQINTRASNASPMSNAFEARSSTNLASARASTVSNMTNDSNMDLLLARLEAQNEMLEQESKRRVTTESEMERALGNAKEGSSGEDIDWDYWGALMHDYETVVKKNPKQLTAMIQKGVPSALRGLIWQLLAKSKDAQVEGTYAELLKKTSSHEKQITRDLSRTFPNHEHFQANGPGQEALFNVVKAYSLYDTEVGYCQGLSFVVGPLLLNMPEEEAFGVLVRMMNSYGMRGHYTPEMNVLQLRLYQFEQLMEETVPLIFKHFQNQGIRSTMYASQWFMTLFAYKFPLELVFRVYDIIFVEGVESLLRFAIALLKVNHDRILSYDFDVLIEFLKNGLFEPYVNDSSLLIQDAYNVKVTPKKLTQYAQKYQAMVQKQQAEMAAEESLRESNRQLSSHVRRLESSLHTLNKEHVDLAKELITRKMEMAQLQNQNDVLSQKVMDLTKIVDSQAKEVEERYKDEIQMVLNKNMEYLKKNEQLEDQLAYLENVVIETKMKYCESEQEKDALSRKLADLRKALGVS